MKNPVFLIDSRFLAYRSVHALMNTPISDVKVAMYYGFMNTLLKLSKGISINKKIVKPHNIILCWDSIHSYRRMICFWYKKVDISKKTKEQIETIKTIRDSFPGLRQWMKRIGFTSNLGTGLEADDIMAALAYQNPNTNFILITNDEDMFQVLGKNAAMYMLKKKNIYFTETDFIEKYGIMPRDWAVVKAVGGCKSDGISGIKGVGEKTAIQYVKKELSQRQLYNISNEIARCPEPYLMLTFLPFGAKEIKNLDLSTSIIDWEQWTKFCQVYGLNYFVTKFNEFKEAFDYGND